MTKTYQSWVASPPDLLMKITTVPENPHNCICEELLVVKEI